MELAKILANNYVFRGLDKEIMAAIASLAEVRDFVPGDTLVRQFDFNSDLIILLEGEAVVKTFSGENITTLGPGSIAGEISLIDEQPRSATVLATKSGKVAFIQASVMRGVLEMDAKSAAVILSNLCKVLCRRLRAMNVHIDAIERD